MPFPIALRSLRRETYALDVSYQTPNLDTESQIRINFESTGDRWIWSIVYSLLSHYTKGLVIAAFETDSKQTEGTRGTFWQGAF